MSHFANILDGFASILELPTQGRRKYVLNDNGFVDDRKNLRSDVKIVGRDLREGLRKYGQSSRSREGYKQGG
ncbi:MAG: hypothetical protein AB7V26_03410 [Lysobacterales bacterium]